MPPEAKLKLYKAAVLPDLILVPYGIFVRPAIRDRLKGCYRKGGLVLYTVTAVLCIFNFYKGLNYPPYKIGDYN